MSTLVDDPAASPTVGGIYEVPEAARYLRADPLRPKDCSLRSTTLIHWIRRGLASPALADTPGRDLLIDFEDLISMRVITLLRAYGVGWREIDRTEQWLREVKGITHPFATEHLWTGQRELFAEWEERLVSGSRRGQAALDLLRDYVVPVKDLRFGEESRLAISWEPFDGVLLEPQVQFGAPCIKGTRIPTRSIHGMIAAGDAPKWVAEAYEISIAEVRAAYDWESLLDAA